VAGVITGGHTVTVLRYTTDRYGDRTKVSEHTVDHCAFAPRVTTGGRDASELTDRSATVTADAELYAPPGADITPTDVVRLADGTEWEVAGAVESWQSPFPGAWAPGVVVPLRRRTG
jgi:hypothetical protein